MIGKTIKSCAVALAACICIAAIYTATTSSAEEPSIEKLSEQEMKEWSNRNDTIFRKGAPVSIFEHYEYEVNPNHRKPNIQAELCFIQIDDDPENTFPMIRYIYTLHPSSKVQVEFKDQYDRISRWKKIME